jgi:hypothetical protein
VNILNIYINVKQSHSQRSEIKFIGCFVKQEYDICSSSVCFSCSVVCDIKRTLQDMAGMRRDRGYAWVVMVACSFGFVVESSILQCMTIVYQALLQRFDMSVADTGTVGAVSTAAMHFTGKNPLGSQCWIHIGYTLIPLLLLDPMCTER